MNYDRRHLAAGLLIGRVSTGANVPAFEFSNTSVGNASVDIDPTVFGLGIGCCF